VKDIIKNAKDKEMADIIELKDSNYTAFIEETDSVVFIDFYSDTCGPCQTLMTYLPNLAEHYKDKNVVIAKVNSVRNPKLSAKFMVRSVPLTIIVGKDKMVKHAEMGLLSINAYFKMIDKELKKGKGLFSRFFS
jgi:thioredoxin-like negative regulator of GroEL